MMLHSQGDAMKKIMVFIRFALDPIRNGNLNGLPHQGREISNIIYAPPGVNLRRKRIGIGRPLIEARDSFSTARQQGRCKSPFEHVFFFHHHLIISIALSIKYNVSFLVISGSEGFLHQQE